MNLIAAKVALDRIQKYMQVGCCAVLCCAVLCCAVSVGS